MTTYTLKMSLPAHKKDETVYQKGTAWYWTSNNHRCDFNPEKEKDFFEKTEVASHADGTIVRLTAAAVRTIRDKKYENVDFEVVSHTIESNRIKYKIQHGKKHFYVKPVDIYNPIFYWFINSSGKVHRAITDDSYVYNFRSVTGNVYDTKEWAVTALEIIKQKL